MIYIFSSLKKGNLKGIINLYLRYSKEQFLYKGDRFLYEFLKYMKEKEIFVAKHRNQVVGCVYTLKHLGGSGWLGGLFVDPNHRQKGIGTNLVKCCLEYLKEKKCTDVFLFTDQNNIAAVNLFKKLGFDIVYHRLRFYKKVNSEKLYFDLLKKIEYATESDMEKLKNLIQNSQEVKGRHYVIPFYYYPVNLNKEMIISLIKSRKVLTYKQKGEYKGIVIFQEVPVARIDDIDFIFREELARKIKIDKKDKFGEINITIGSDKEILFILYQILNIFKKQKVKGINYYSYIGDPHFSTIEKMGFVRLKPFNLMKCKFV